MLDKLPSLIWKIILPYIYADHRAQVWAQVKKPIAIDHHDSDQESSDEFYDSSEECATSNIFDDKEDDFRGKHEVIKVVTSLRQTCKYMREVILTPAMCEYVLTSYQLSINSNYIVAVPKPPKFIQAYWNSRIDHHDIPKSFAKSLHWIRALTFDVKRITIDEVLGDIRSYMRSNHHDHDYNEFGWTIFLTNTALEFDRIRLDQSIELVGFPDTRLGITYTLDSDHRNPPSMRIRDLTVICMTEHHPNNMYYLGHNYDHLMIENCTFKGTCKESLVVSSMSVVQPSTLAWIETLTMITRFKAMSMQRTREARSSTYTAIHLICVKWQ